MSRKEWADKKLFFRLLNNKSDKTYWENICELRSRPNRNIFDKSLDLITSESFKERIIGIDILAQLGVPPRPFIKETINLYFDTLEIEKVPKVLTSLLYAIGHNNDNLNQIQISQLVKFKNNKSTSVRKGLVSSLLGLEDEQAIGTLIELSNDKISSIRDWSTFGIGSQIDTDNDDIRDALWNRINDKSQDAKLEAIVGIAKRKDIKIKEIIKRELLSGEYGMLLFDAIELLDDAEFIPLLERNLTSGKLEKGINPQWLEELEKLIDRLKKNEKTTA